MQIAVISEHLRNGKSSNVECVVVFLQVMQFIKHEYNIVVLGDAIDAVVLIRAMQLILLYLFL